MSQKFLSGYTQKADEFMGNLALAIIRRKWLVLAGVMLLLVGAASRLPNLQFDTSLEAFFHDEDPVLIEYNNFKDDFGSDKAVLLTIKTPGVFEKDTIRKLVSLHEKLEKELPYLDEVISLANITYVEGKADELLIEDLLKDWEQKELSELKRKALSNPLYKDLIISSDATLTTLMLRPVAFLAKDDTGIRSSTSEKKAANAESELGGFDGESELGGFEEEAGSSLKSSTAQADKIDDNSSLVHLSINHEREFMAVVKKITAQFNSDDFRIYIGGLMVMESDIMDSMQSNMPIFTVIAISLICILLSVLYRRVSAVVIPLIVVIISLIFTLALMSITGTAFTLTSQILPSFLLAVGVGDSVHLITIFYQHLAKGVSKEVAIQGAMKHAGFACLITSLTTAGGLLSFSMAELLMIAELGIFGAAGVLIAMLLSIVLIPTLLAIVPIKPMKQALTSESMPLLTKMGLFACRNPRRVIFSGFLLFVLGCIMAAQLRFSHNPINWMPEGHELRVSNDFINEKMKGAMFAELILETETENEMKTLKWMEALDEFHRQAEQVSYGGVDVGKVTSLADTLKQINKALHENSDEYYSIPQDSDLIAQELILFENGGSDDLERQTDALYTTARVSIKMPWLDANRYKPIIDELEQIAREVFPENGQITITGMVTMISKTIILLLSSMMLSYLVAILSISFMMILVLGRFRLGLVSMIPNVLPIVMGLGVMGALDLPLDAMSILVGSIALGLAVDDTIHFFHHFQLNYRLSGNVEQAVISTINTTGKAMLFTTVILSLAFLSFIFSEMSNLFSFGVTTSFTICIALFADILLAPAIIRLMFKDKPQGVESASN